MSSYWSYYLIWVFLSYAIHEPWLLAGVGVFLVLRRFIPDPLAIFAALSRGRALRAQVDVNPANVTARRELAYIYLEILRPRAALALVEQALTRAPDDPEMLYLRGLTLHRLGRYEDALAPLVRAVERDVRVRFGQPYRVAGDSLWALGRTEAAIDAYERYAETNGADVVVHVQLARAHARLGEHAAARRSIAEAIKTWHGIRGRAKRRSFLRGYLAAQWGRVWLLREPAAIVVALCLVAGSAFVTRAAYPPARKMVREWLRPAPKQVSIGPAEMLYRGQIIKLTREYDDFDDYKNDPDNIAPSELPRIERMMSSAPIGPSYDSWREFVADQAELIFPGYGAGGGPRVTANGRDFMASSVEIPHAEKDRIFVLEKHPDGSLRLVDDFVAPSAGKPNWPKQARLEGNKLVYLGVDDKPVRETNL